MALHPADSDPDKLIRAFIAVDVGEAVRKALVPALERLRRIDSQVRWVDPKNWHLTVKFLGDVEWRAVDGMAKALQEETATLPAFEFRVRGLFPFPPGRSPRIVAAGIEDSTRGLESLNRALEARMQAFGIPPERRGFKAHLTLGRVQNPRGQDRLWSVLKKFEAEDFGTAHVKEAVLYRSELDPKGAQYTLLATAKLTK
ncbi:MAG: RNA 2',3'-cyclic phosphodiesterase [Planctomycetes bacterium]|nr:RNA 2',3'-cyclic phosphodiesterase [Planctomycetota bacterium]